MKERFDSLLELCDASAPKWNLQRREKKYLLGIKKGETSLARLISPLVGLTPNLSQNKDSRFSAFVQRFQPIAQIQTKLI